MTRFLTVGAAQMGPIQRSHTRRDVVERLIAHLREAKRMTGLGGEHDPKGAKKGDRDTTAADGDPCGNAAEFYRLCVKLARVADGLKDEEAHAQCAARWPSPNHQATGQVVGSTTK